LLATVCAQDDEDDIAREISETEDRLRRLLDLHRSRSSETAQEEAEEDAIKKETHDRLRANVLGLQKPNKPKRNRGSTGRQNDVMDIIRRYEEAKQRREDEQTERERRIFAIQKVKDIENTVERLKDIADNDEDHEETDDGDESYGPAAPIDRDGDIAEENQDVEDEKSRERNEKHDKKKQAYSRLAAKLLKKELRKMRREKRKQGGKLTVADILRMAS